jgi:hypothetical protein
MTPGLDGGAVAELVDATRLFVSRHEEALLSADPARLVEACDGMHKGLCGTLSEEAGRLHNALRAARSPPPPVSPATLPEALARLRGGDAVEHEAWAFAAVAKRLAEAEGALLHLRLTLSRGAADGPASLPYARRVAAETYGVHRTMAALLAVLDAWAQAYRAAVTGSKPPAPPVPSTREGLRAARESLLAGVPEAAGPALAGALVAGLSAPFPGAADLEDALARWEKAGLAPPAPAASCREAHRALREGVRDPVLAWRLLDFVEHVANNAGMTRPPSLNARPGGAPSRGS